MPVCSGTVELEWPLHAGFVHVMMHVHARRPRRYVYHLPSHTFAIDRYRCRGIITSFGRRIHFYFFFFLIKKNENIL